MEPKKPNASLHSSTAYGGEVQGQEVWKKDCMNSTIHFQHLDNGIFFMCLSIGGFCAGRKNLDLNLDIIETEGSVFQF